MSADDSFNDAQPNASRPSDAEDSFDDDGGEDNAQEWLKNALSSFSPRNWPRIYLLSKRHYRSMTSDGLSRLLGSKRFTNETPESMITRLEAGHRIAMRKAARRFAPKKRLIDHLDRYLLLLRAHVDWIDNHHTHDRNRLYNRPDLAEGVHVEYILRLREAVRRTSLDPFCTGHSEFVRAMEKRCRRLNKLSQLLLTHVQSTHKRSKSKKHNNRVLTIDIERTF